jgi:porphyrinogen peroxidase
LGERRGVDEDVVMATPQAGIFALGTRTHHHLELDVRSDAPVASVAEALGGLGAPHVTAGGNNLVVGFGAELWRRLADGPPADLAPFAPIGGLDGHTAPSSQHDIWVWIHGTGSDVVLDTAIAVADVLEPVASVADATECFVYHDSRDLTGFIDGTENPGPGEAAEVAVVPDGHPGAGGSHVIAQRWVHDLAAFERLDVDEQQRVFGRTKLDSVALPRASRPVDAHIMRAELLDDDGRERRIYRRSVPFGNVRERGLYFLGFSGERERFDGMLARMFGTSGDGIHDHLLDFTRAVSGSYYFAPSVEDLAALSASTGPLGG